MYKRICNKCGKEKFLIDFYKDKTRLLGRSYVCRFCDNERRRILAATSQGLLKSKTYQRSEQGKIARRLWQKREYWINRHKHTARKMVEAMVKSGDIIKKPCEVCGKERSLAHHPNYAKPLEVKWLCQKHHSEIHRNMKIIN